MMGWRPSDSCLTAFGGVLAFPPQAVKLNAQRAQIPLIINN